MPLSPEPRKRVRPLANLRSAPPAPRGNRRGVTHDGYVAIARERLEAMSARYSTPSRLVPGRGRASGGASQPHAPRAAAALAHAKERARRARRPAPLLAGRPVEDPSPLAALRLGEELGRDRVLSEGLGFLITGRDRARHSRKVGVDAGGQPRGK